MDNNKWEPNQLVPVNSTIAAPTDITFTFTPADTTDVGGYTFYVSPTAYAAPIAMEEYIIINYELANGNFILDSYGRSVSSDDNGKTQTDSGTNNRPKCDWPVAPPADPTGNAAPCGSEEGLMKVKYGPGQIDRIVCRPHLKDAWKGDVIEAAPLDRDL